MSIQTHTPTIPANSAELDDISIQITVTFESWVCIFFCIISKEQKGEETSQRGVTDVRFFQNILILFTFSKNRPHFGVSVYHQTSANQYNQISKSWVSTPAKKRQVRRVHAIINARHSYQQQCCGAQAQRGDSGRVHVTDSVLRVHAHKNATVDGC